MNKLSNNKYIILIYFTHYYRIIYPHFVICIGIVIIFSEIYNQFFPIEKRDSIRNLIILDMSWYKVLFDNKYIWACVQ